MTPAGWYALDVPGDAPRPGACFAGASLAAEARSPRGARSADARSADDGADDGDGNTYDAVDGESYDVDDGDAPAGRGEGAGAPPTRTSPRSSKRAAPYAAPPDGDDFDEEDEAAAVTPPEPAAEQNTAKEAAPSSSEATAIHDEGGDGGGDGGSDAQGDAHGDSHDDSDGGASDGGGDGVDDLLRSRPVRRRVVVALQPRAAPQPRTPPSERASMSLRPFSIRPKHREAFSRLGWTLKDGLYVSPGLAGISFNSGNLALRSLPEADAQQFFPDFWAYLRAPQPRKTLTPRTSRGAAADDDTCVGAAAAPQTWTFSRSSKRPAPSYAEDDEVDYDEDAPPPPQARHQRRREERRRGGDDDDDATNVGLVGAAAALRTWTSSRSSKRPAPSYAEDEVDYDDEDPLPHAPSAPFHVPLSHCDAYREEFRQLGWDLTYRQCGKRWLYTSPADMTYPSATKALQSLPEAVAQQSFPAFWAHSWVPQPRGKPRGKPRAKPQPPPPSAAAAAAGQGNSPSMMQNAAPVVDEGDDNDASDHLPVDRSRGRGGVFRVKNSQNETLREAFRQLGWGLTFNGHWWFKSPAGTIYASAWLALHSLPEAVARQSFPDFWAHSWAPKPRAKPRAKPQPPPPSAAAAAGGQGGSPSMHDAAPPPPTADEDDDYDASDFLPIGQLRLYVEASTARDAAAAALAASSSASAAARGNDAFDRGESFRDANRGESFRDAKARDRETIQKLGWTMYYHNPPDKRHRRWNYTNPKGAVFVSLTTAIKSLKPQVVRDHFPAYSKARQRASTQRPLAVVRLAGERGARGGGAAPATATVAAPPGLAQGPGPHLSHAQLEPEQRALRAPADAEDVGAAPHRSHKWRDPPLGQEHVAVPPKSHKKRVREHRPRTAPADDASPQDAYVWDEERQARVAAINADAEGFAAALIVATVRERPEALLFLTGAGVELECFSGLGPRLAVAHVTIAAIRAATAGLVAHVTTNVTGMQCFAEARDVVHVNFALPHRSIHDARCSCRNAGADSMTCIYKPRGVLCARASGAIVLPPRGDYPGVDVFAPVAPVQCKHSKAISGCIPSACSRDTEHIFKETIHAERITQPRRVLVVMGNSLDKSANGTGLSWLSTRVFDRVVIVDPLAASDPKKFYDRLVRRLGIVAIRVEDWPSKIVVVPLKADVFAARLNADFDRDLPDLGFKGRLHRTATQANEAMRAFAANHGSLPPLPPDYTHPPVVNVRNAFIRAFGLSQEGNRPDERDDRFCTADDRFPCP